MEAHTITATFEENRSCVVRTGTIYALHSGKKAEERFRAFSGIDKSMVKATLPPGRPPTPRLISLMKTICWSATPSRFTQANQQASDLSWTHPIAMR